jgi:hypothetical protein
VPQHQHSDGSAASAWLAAAAVLVTCLLLLAPRKDHAAGEQVLAQLLRVNAVLGQQQAHRTRRAGAQAKAGHLATSTPHRPPSAVAVPGCNSHHRRGRRGHRDAAILRRRSETQPPPRATEGTPSQHNGLPMTGFRCQPRCSTTLRADRS